MQSVAVVKLGYVIQHVLLCFEPGLVAPPVDAFLLQASEETLSNGVAQQSPLRLILPTKPWIFSNCRFSWLAYCAPRSVCTISPAPVFLSQMAIVRASQTSWAFIREPMLQPTTFLEYRSITTAKYNQPSCVQM